MGEKPYLWRFFQAEVLRVAEAGVLLGLVTGQRGSSMKKILLPLLCLVIPVLAHAKSAKEIYQEASKSVVVVLGQGQAAASQGSGVVFSEEIVATACHVVKEAKEIKVRYRGREYPGTLKSADWERDLCLIDVWGLKAPAVRAGVTQSLKPGDKVYAIGAPQGLELTISEGIVSALREVSGGRYIQTTAPISSGSSGGGLFDEEGRLVGFTAFYVLEGQNLNFALPVEWAKELLSSPAVLPEPPKAKADSTSWFSLGRTYFEAGDSTKAIEAYKKAISINPQFDWAWYNLGVHTGLLASMGMY